MSHTAQDGDKCRDLVNAAMNPRVPYNSDAISCLAGIIYDPQELYSMQTVTSVTQRCGIIQMDLKETE